MKLQEPQANFGHTAFPRTDYNPEQGMGTPDDHPEDAIMIQVLSRPHSTSYFLPKREEGRLIRFFLKTGFS